MKIRLKAILAAMAILALWWFLYWHQVAYQEPVRYQKFTPQQHKAIDKAIKIHGDYPMVGDKKTSRVDMILNGKRIRIL
jgi:hypothetical protein